MKIPLQVTFRDMPPSEAVEIRIREKAEKLGRFCDRIIHCRVVVEMPQRHKHQGKLHCVRIDVSVPGAELVANHAQSEDVYIALRDAFAAITRQVENHARRQRGEIKTHAAHASLP
jgi:ribosomal subunit interface protein